VTVKLASRELGGSGPPIIVLHGLLGSSRNWQSAGAALALRGPRVIALDLRNHGDSPWADECRVTDMVEDVVAWINQAAIAPVHLLGHSLGGKVAMRLAVDHPALVSRLTVVDIAPRVYAPRFMTEFAAMRSVDLSALKSRRDAENALEAHISNWALRQFILTNLSQGPTGNWLWKVNLDALERGLPGIQENPLMPGQSYQGPTRLIRGGMSNYVLDEDIPHFLQYFPHGDVVTLSDSGHNPHFDARSGFLDAVLT
jgi:pimeloyl-ACP methyl ester carboxylesterase